ncbi:hypothetical protein [Thermoactinomyces sp. CICC 10521]|uniref:hypothetical protein n=1 Tax=Thermoactinomyces sp. CICC 10521 TaxID=2767426 RepID=UPI0018DE81E4|nr:hypothetical protein [Thermoactinomyces sp. CICC 10521]MBH8606707.1 hypothetical protein [Thermoactinomyces sp. CICC 10521]
MAIGEEASFFLKASHVFFDAPGDESEAKSGKNVAPLTRSATLSQKKNKTCCFHSLQANYI